MREIKFRGKACDEWVHGSLIVCEDGHCVINWVDGLRHVSTDIGVAPETVGQFTGLKDSTGKEIYEGDIVRTDDWSTPSYIRWDVATASFVVDRWSVNLAHVSQIKVIGNVHDNPELLEAHV